MKLMLFAMMLAIVLASAVTIAVALTRAGPPGANQQISLLNSIDPGVQTIQAWDTMMLTHLSAITIPAPPASASTDWLSATGPPLLAIDTCPDITGSSDTKFYDYEGKSNSSTVDTLTTTASARPRIC